MDNRNLQTNKQATPRPLLKVTEAARYLAVCERTIWSLVAEGAIPAVRFGKVVRIDKADLDEFIQRMKTGDARRIGMVVDGEQR